MQTNLQDWIVKCDTMVVKCDTMVVKCDTMVVKDFHTQSLQENEMLSGGSLEEQTNQVNIMPLSRQSSYNIPDEFPARPTSLLRNELHRLNSRIEKQQTYTLVLLCLAYFIYGSGASLYGPLYPPEAKFHQVTSELYGPAIAVNSLASVLFYPIACRMVATISCKQSIGISILMIGGCRILFGTLVLVTETLPFVLLSFGIQAVEGVGIAVLLSSSYVAIFSQYTDKTIKYVGVIPILFALGLTTGPIAGEAVNSAYGFSITFYGAGVLTILVGAFITALLPEPDNKLTFKELPVLSWIKQPKLLIYCILIFATFNYIGFLTVVLEPLSRQFHLNKLFIGFLFAIPPFVCGLSAPAWKWISKKGVNSVLLVCISSIFIFASLILIGPAPFTTLDISLLNVSLALFLNGLGSGGKLSCIIYAASRDLRWMRSVSGICEPLIIPTMFVFGSLSGYFSGAITTSFTEFYLGRGTATYILLALEAVTAVVAFIFAFQRNYRSPTHPLHPEERQPILAS